MEYASFKEQLAAEEQFLAEYDARIEKAKAKLAQAEQKVREAVGPAQYRPALLAKDEEKKKVQFLIDERPQTEMSLRWAMEQAEQDLYSAKKPGRLH